MKLEHCHSLECKQHIDTLSEALSVADEGRNYANEVITKLSEQLAAMTKERDDVIEECANAIKHDCDCGCPCDCFGPSTARIQIRALKGK